MTQDEPRAGDDDATVAYAFSLPAPRAVEAGSELAPCRSMRVLIVDDEEEVAAALCAALSSWGHDVRKCSDGGSGLAIAGQQLPEVVLLDLEMPAMDGYELARRLRLRPDLRGSYLIAMRSAGKGRGSLGIESSIDQFLPKPMNLAVLETLLRMEGERLDRLA